MIHIKHTVCILLLGLLACDSGNLEVLADLPKKLAEVSGTETCAESDLIWMLNDSGNKPRLFGLNEKGEIQTQLKIDAKNNDWEDLTTDANGNIYIGDFGNNLSERKNLAILKVAASDLKNDSLVSVERIGFKYDNQLKFPPKKQQLYFDSEAFFFYNDSLYIFTKSRVRGNFGRTDLYKIPATHGQHLAAFIDSFTTCEGLDCWVTSADISDDGSKMVLLTPKSAFVFSNFKSDNFFKGDVEEYPFDHESQKEGVCFKTNTILFITDERAHGTGGNLYKFNLD